MYDTHFVGLQEKITVHSKDKKKKVRFLLGRLHSMRRKIKWKQKKGPTVITITRELIGVLRHS